jgi:hypothetical protein
MQIVVVPTLVRGWRIASCLMEVGRHTGQPRRFINVVELVTVNPLGHLHNLEEDQIFLQSLENQSKRTEKMWVAAR